MESRNMVLMNRCMEAAETDIENSLMDTGLGEARVG